MRLAIDMSSLLWTCLSVGTDVEGKKIEHNGRLVQVNKAAYGYENSVNSVIATMRNCGVTPKDVIMVFEGIDSKAPRLAIANTYKAKRGNRPPEAYAEFQELKERLQDVFGKLGALSLTQDNAEGDDTLGWLAVNSEEDLVISTNDGDMTVLNGTNSYGATITVVVNGAVGHNKYGDWPTQYVTVYKAMLGDTTDSISGIKGFGPKAWEDFLKEFGVDGLKEMDRIGRLGCMDDFIPDLDNAMVAKIYAGREDFFKSFQLALIHPEWVNTFDNPLQFKPGLIKGSTGDERLKHWEATSLLVTADNWDAASVWAHGLIAHTPTVPLDIETSTPDESDEWLAAQGEEEGTSKVDVIGSELTGMSLTFGDNLQHTIYISVDHADTNNVPKQLLKAYIKGLADAGVQFVIQNFNFEGPVLFNEWGKEWLDNGFEGLLPNCLDSKIEASYVDENDRLGLKSLSKKWFNYDQVDYKTVTTIDGVPHKMRELSGAHVKDYGCDDTIVTGSLHNFFKLFMQLEHTWQVYLQVEIDAMYAHAQSFVNGVKCSVARSKELEAIDDATYNASQIIFEEYLIQKGWAGTVRPVYTAESTPAQLKEAFQIVYGKPLETAVRKLDRLAEAMREQGGPIMAEMLLLGNWKELTDYVQSYWTAKPIFNTGSPKQMQNLMYEVMGLPIRVKNKPTLVMRRAGVPGSPKTDALAFAYAMAMDATAEQKPVLEALKLMKMVETRRGLYYRTYPYFVHWKTGRIHSSHNQCATNTRRASSSSPNLQQMPKHPKIEGQPARFREVIVPHKPNAVIVSMDFASQELRVIADYSQDQNMLDCYIGDSLKDMHALTGLGIAMRKQPAIEWSYELFEQIRGDKTSPMHKEVKEFRNLGKKVNFTTEYGAMAPKLAATMLVGEEEAQAYIDAKEAAFPRAGEWKQEVIAEAKQCGYVLTKLGAKRHLQKAFTSSDRYEASKAERQAVNFKIQSSSAEMTKLAEGRMFKARLEQRFDAQIIGPVHDEVLASCVIEDLPGFLSAMHSCMVQKYADMNVPIESSISFGPSFGEQIEIGSLPTQEALDAGLVEYYKLINKVAERGEANV